MLIPSIDIVNGQAVQLIGGEETAISGGDPFTWLERFSRVGEVAVIDIDAARGEGHNADLIARMCRMAPIRVGGGIRDYQTATRWLDRGAAKIIIGTAADPSLLSRLPRSRVIAAIDSRDDRVLAEGWRRETGDSLLDQISTLSPHAGGLLVTFVELEGRMQGTDLDRAARVARVAGDTRVTVAGGVSDASEIAALDALGIDAQVGMALYSGELSLARAFTAPMTSDRADGLWPTVVVDEAGKALGLVYSSLKSLDEALASGAGVYHSRTRGVWRKGATSGATQDLLRVTVDCDRDALRFTVRQSGEGFCHTGSRSCFGEDRGISRLARRLAQVAVDRPSESNTVKLLDDPDLLSSKLTEEAAELGAATSLDAVAHEAADLIYFALTKAAAAGVDIDRIEAELDRRELRVTRRPMDRSTR